ncbi:MAG: SRPBCC family protein [Bdellovibrionales bacterium]|nr:SRPBCC family protein [Bdellovibrionales bacterium]
MAGTVKLHRVFTAPPERVFRAFTDPYAKSKWLPPSGFIAKSHSDDFRVGGKYKMSFINFSTGNGHTFGGEYIEIKPNELLRYNDKFDDPNLPGEMQVSVHFKKVSCGTELTVVQEGIPDAIPPEMCYLGWQESLNQLALLVNPNIPDGT